MESERDERTFPERVERINVAFLVSLPTAQLERFSQLVEDDINETGAKLVYTKSSSARLFIDEDRRPPRREVNTGGMEPPKNWPHDQRRRFNYGTDGSDTD